MLLLEFESEGVYDDDDDEDEGDSFLGDDM